ncbi:hypothetical protein AA12717_0021 [Gluconacetobacter sacchari DSM 12717]|uniref:Uncharacterized protein n=1 Tax=Gluconacetobacter sacchari DSM 12717 TaxID=1307940 RepID=A0ABQ0P4W8_9PROT|nr:hypothetical protein AA12717_0021 [Gluconacetobacter sacchari DSM 12717]
MRTRRRQRKKVCPAGKVKRGEAIRSSVGGGRSVPIAERACRAGGFGGKEGALSGRSIVVMQ